MFKQRRCILIDIHKISLHCAVLFSCYLNNEKVREVNRKRKYHLLDFWDIIQSPKLYYSMRNTDYFRQM